MGNRTLRAECKPLWGQIVFPVTLGSGLNSAQLPLKSAEIRFCYASAAFGPTTIYYNQDENLSQGWYLFVHRPLTEISVSSK